MNGSLKANRSAIGRALLTICVVSLSGCADDEPKARLFTIRSGELYVCLSDAITASLPPQCGQWKFGADDQPQLVGTIAKKFIAEAGGDGTFYADAVVSGDQLVRYSNFKVEWRPKE